jgi:NhaA family Na+:H+ antiporter
LEQPARSFGEAVQRAEKSPFPSSPSLRFQRFAHTESVGAIALLAAAVAAVVWSNSAWSDSYHALWERTYLGFDLGFLQIRESLRHWVNDGLMVIFFFVVGLEVKRELVHGDLSSFKKAGFPVAAALGGMLAPAAIYAAFNSGGDGAAGWGIPMATDIAFALGVFALAGRGIPIEARVFLLALAAVDDIGAILVIAIFYSHEISFGALGVATAALALMYGLRRLGLWDIKWYLAGGFIVWLAVFESGIHATIAGVVLGLLTPSDPPYAHERAKGLLGDLVEEYRGALAKGRDEAAEVALGRIETLAIETEAPMERRMRATHPWSSFLVLPLFALANAGIEISGSTITEAVGGAVFLGVTLGLIFGKILGILTFGFAAVKMGLAEMPGALAWRHVAAVSVVAGIGFTVSLFITDLALRDESLVQQAKIGVFGASVAAGAAGLAVLKLAGRRP